MRIAVTGAYGFSGKYIARRLLDLRHEVITLTNSPHRANAFGESIKAFPYNFSRPHLLEKSLSGFDVLINTYWVSSGWSMSALPPEADIRRRIEHVCFVP